MHQNRCTFSIVVLDGLMHNILCNLERGLQHQVQLQSTKKVLDRDLTNSGILPINVLTGVNSFILRAF